MNYTSVHDLNLEIARLEQEQSAADVARLTKQRDELAAALREMVEWGLKMNRTPRPNSPVEKARAALAKLDQ
jgi:hypothetical protein